MKQLLIGLSTNQAPAQKSGRKVVWFTEAPVEAIEHSEPAKKLRPESEVGKEHLP